MKLQTSPMTKKEIESILLNTENQNKIVLLQDISLNKVSCSKCNAWAHDHHEISHKSCCPYVGGNGCYAG